MKYLYRCYMRLKYTDYQAIVASVFTVLLGLYLSPIFFVFAIIPCSYTIDRIPEVFNENYLRAKGTSNV